MISVEEFLAVADEKGLLSGELLAELRRCAAGPIDPANDPPWNKPVTAARLAKWLVDHGHLSRLLAQQLLARVEVAPPPPVEEPPEAAQPSTIADEELGFAPMPEDETGKPSAWIPVKPAAGDAEASKPPPPLPPAEEPPKREPPKREPPKREPEPADSPQIGESLWGDEIATPGRGKPADLEPLEPLIDGALLDSAAAAAGDPLSSSSRRKRGWLRSLTSKAKLGKFRKKENVWDSSLLLVGGGALLALVILGGVVIWHSSRQNADEMLEAANDFYQQGSYTNAIENYNRYLEAFPDDSGASLARVRRGLCQLRQATDTTRNWSAALETAKDVVEKMSSETAFGVEARPELASLLPKIAEGLADQARDTLDPELVDDTKEALALVEKYIPRSRQPVTRLTEVITLLAFTEREIACGRRRDEAVAEMLEAVSQGEAARAHEIRNALLKEYPPERYPQLAGDEKLDEAMAAVSQAEQSSVKIVPQRQQAQTADPPEPVLATVALARRNVASQAADAEGHVVFVQDRGAAYGLDAADGKVLWRRPVGFSVSGWIPRFPPTPIDGQAGSDVVMVDARRNEVLRVEAATGRLRWRHPLGERFDAQPVVADDLLLVPTRSGRLVLIDLDSGDSSGYLQLPQGLPVAAVVDAARSQVYQVTEHSNLFVLSLAESKATQVVYLEHKPGSITVPPVLISRFLVVAENDGGRDGRLRVLAIEGTDEHPPMRLIQEIRLDGHVDATPLVAGLRLLVTTDRGDIRGFEVNASDTEAPLVKIAEGTAAGEPYLEDAPGPAELVRFPLLAGGQVWIADSQLTRYDLQPTHGRLQPQGIENEGSVSLQPLVAIGRTVFHVRRKLGLGGVIVSAFSMGGGTALWETHLAAPLVAEPHVDAQTGKITAVASTGAVFQLEAPGVAGQTVLDQPAAELPAAEVRRSVTDLVHLGDDLVALATVGGPSHLSVVDLQSETKRFRRLTLPGPLSCRPVALAGGLAAPCQVGQVLLLDPRSGRKLAEAFQPRLEGNARIDWREPAVIADRELVLSDGRDKLYRIAVKDDPIPHLDTLVVPVDLAETIVSPVAALERVAYAVDAAGALITVNLPNLSIARTQPLSGRCVWGPRRVGRHVLLATDDDRLHCLSDDKKLLWEVDLPYGPLAGAPLEDGEQIILAAAAGVIWTVDAATGEQLGRIDTGYPLGTGPVLLGDHLLVGGYDGSLYKLEKPSANPRDR